MLTDIEIAQHATLRPIGEIAARLGIPGDALIPYGRTKAKISLDWLARVPARDGHAGRLPLSGRLYNSGIAAGAR